MQLTEEIVRKKVEELEKIIQEYKLLPKEEKKRDWRSYEAGLATRIRVAVKELEPLIKQAVGSIHRRRGPGRKPTLTLKQKVVILLLKQLLGLSNRVMASVLSIFGMLLDIEISYKTVERLYSDPEVYLALSNLHQLILRKKGIESADVSGDGTGYSLTISKHYRQEISKRGDKAKRQGWKGRGKKKLFAYAFYLMDLETKMYICYGTGMRSEKEAFNRAMLMLKGTGVKIRSARLDRYYSYRSTLDAFGDAKVYLIPKKNVTLRGSKKWKNMLRSFLTGTFAYLKEYFRRNNSESGFSSDKRRFGWTVRQRKDERIDVAQFTILLWHNLFLLA
jgi:transposase